MTRSKQRGRTMRYQAAFLVGCMAGCFVSSAFYIWWSGVLMVSERYRVQLAPFPPSMALQPSGAFFSRRSDRLWSLAGELRSKRRLLVAVLTSRQRLNDTVVMVREILGDGAVGVDYAVFVAGEGPSIPGVYWLRRMRDLREREGNLTQIFHVLSYLDSSFVRHYHWFLLASHDTYIAVSDTEEMLSRLDAAKPVYMGRPASDSPSVMATLHLLTNEYFCEWGPGIILSNAALAAVSEHLDICKKLSGSFGSHSSNQDLRPGRGDVELGRCFSRKVGIRCTSSREAQLYFVSDPDQYSRSPERLWYSTELQSLLTLYPVTDPDHMIAVHHFVQHRTLQRQQLKLALAENRTSDICKRVNPEFAAPLTEPEARSCHTQAFTTCPSSPKTLLNFNNISQELPPIFKVKNRFEVVPWMYMTQVGLYQSTTITPVFRVDGELREEVNFIVKRVISMVNLREAAEWVLWKLKGCHLRYSGTRGREYLLDMVLEERVRGVRRRRRWRVLRPHGLDLLLQEDSGAEALKAKVNILIPVSKVGGRFFDFLQMYERDVARQRENATLILVVFGSDSQIVNQTMEKFLNRNPDAEFTIVFNSGQFTRGLALHIAMAQLNDSDLAFICDIDMSFDSSFLEHCRLNAVQGSRVYFPEFFKLYDMSYVYRFRRRPAKLTIKREHGHWASYSYGMACMYRSDYISSGGFDTAITGWGGEDVNLFEKILGTGVEILKAPDPYLIHRYHEKTCSLSLNSDQFAMCISSRNEGLADRMQLAEYVYYLEDQCGVKERPLW